MNKMEVLKKINKKFWWKNFTYSTFDSKFTGNLIFTPKK